jgi:hypothetical protein
MNAETTVVNSLSLQQSACRPVLEALYRVANLAGEALPGLTQTTFLFDGNFPGKVVESNAVNRKAGFCRGRCLEWESHTDLDPVEIGSKQH